VVVKTNELEKYLVVARCAEMWLRMHGVPPLSPSPKMRRKSPSRITATVVEVVDAAPFGVALDREKIELAPLYVQAFPRRGRPASRPWAKRKPILTTRHSRALVG